MRVRLLISAAVIACVAALAACDPAGPPSGASSTSASVTTTPSPADSSTPTTPVTTPAAGDARAFGGDCSAMLDAADLTGLFGLDMSPVSVNWSWGAVSALNGLQCTWASTGTYMGAALVAWALPAAAVPADFPAGAWCADDRMCQAVAVADGTWYGVQVPNASEGTDRQAVASSALDRIVAAGAGHAAPVSPASPTGTWSTPLPSCADLAAQVDPAAFGLTETPSLVDVRMPSAPNLRALETALTGGEWCGFTARVKDIADPVFILLLPGAGVAYDEAVAHAGNQTITVEGGRAAGVVLPFLWEGDEGVLATDGANLVAMTASRGVETAAYSAAAGELLRVLKAG